MKINYNIKFGTDLKRKFPIIKNNILEKKILINAIPKSIFQTSLAISLIGASLLSFSAKAMDPSEAKKVPLQIRRISFSSAKKLYESCDKKEKGREALYFLCKNNEVYSSHAAEILFHSNHKEDKRIGRQTLQSCAKEKDERGARAATTLFQGDGIECRNFSREILYSIVRNPEEYCTVSGKEVYMDHLALQLDTATILITKGNKKDKQVGEKTLLDVYNHSGYLRKSKYQNSVGMIAFRLDSNHPVAFAALCDLLDYRAFNYNDFNVKSTLHFSAVERLRDIAGIDGHPYQYQSAKLLYENNEPKAANLLRSIASCKNHPNQKEANELVDNAYPNSTCDLKSSSHPSL